MRVDVADIKSTSPLDCPDTYLNLSFETLDSQQRKMRVVLVNLGPTIESRGGVERIFISMANELVGKGHRVTALCFDAKIGKPAFALDKRVDFRNTGRGFPLFLKSPWKNILSWRVDKNERKLQRELLSVRWKARVLSPILKKLSSETDVFVAFQMQSAWTVRKALGEEVPLITMFHSHPKVYMSSLIWKTYESAVDSSDILTVLMPSYIREVCSRLRNVKVLSVPNPVEISSKQAVLEEKVIVCVARLSREKTAELLIDAWALLHEKYADWRIEWWGGLVEYPNYVEEIRDRIREKGVSDSFCLCGTTDMVNEKMLSASVFAFPSSYEGFPLALTEAMACGLPVVGRTDCSGVNELVRDGENGFLVPPDARLWASALEKLMTDYDLRTRMGSKARESVRKYNPKHIWDLWEKVIFSVL